MQPGALTGPDWTNILALVGTVWTFLVAVAIFGGAFLTAHVFLPSLHPADALRRLSGIRVFLYSLSGVAFVAAAFLGALAVRSVPAIVHFYARFWI